MRDNSPTAHHFSVDQLLAEWQRTLVLVPKHERWHRTICVISYMLHTLAVLEDAEVRP